MSSTKKNPTVATHLFLGLYCHSRPEVFRSADIRLVSLSDLYTRLITSLYGTPDRLCGLVVRVSGYRYRGLGFDSRRYQIF